MKLPKLSKSQKAAVASAIGSGLIALAGWAYKSGWIGEKAKDAAAGATNQIPAIVDKVAK
jgi:hypothetical protein